MAIVRIIAFRMAYPCAAQCLLQCPFDGIDALFADFVGIDRLGDDGQQVIDVWFLLITQGLSVFLQYALGLLEVLLRHISIPISLGQPPGRP